MLLNHNAKSFPALKYIPTLPTLDNFGPLALHCLEPTKSSLTTSITNNVSQAYIPQIPQDAQLSGGNQHFPMFENKFPHTKSQKNLSQATDPRVVALELRRHAHAGEARHAAGVEGHGAADLVAALLVVVIPKKGIFQWGKMVVYL